jgi:hypothetical protein
MQINQSRVIIITLSAVCILAGIVLGIYVLQAGLHPTVVVEWETASELNTAGFNIYRSDNPQGPFDKVNSDLIPASPDSLTGGSYSYRDTQVATSGSYYYQLEDIDFNGNSTLHGPIKVEAGRGNLWAVVLAIIVFFFGIIFLLLGFITNKVETNHG